MKINARKSLGAVWIVLFRGDRLFSERDGAANTFQLPTRSRHRDRFANSGPGRKSTPFVFSREVIKLRLAQTRFGRVLLHVICCLRKPRSLSWHWRGIVREFARAR